jgi:hypothetical protein
MRTLKCHPDAETIGQVLRSFTDNLQGEETRPLMEKHGMADLDPMGWYPVQKLLDGLNDIAENPNVTFNMVAIGMKIGEMVPLPPEMENPTLADVLYIWDDLYQGLHRGADVGRITVEKVNDKHYITRHSNPYPDDMSYGILYAYGRRFLPPGTGFTVFYDPDIKSRDQGGDAEAVTIHIQWD